jgi:hypothetical protein
MDGEENPGSISCTAHLIDQEQLKRDEEENPGFISCTPHLIDQELRGKSRVHPVCSTPQRSRIIAKKLR